MQAKNKSLSKQHRRAGFNLVNVYYFLQSFTPYLAIIKGCYYPLKLTSILIFANIANTSFTFWFSGNCANTKSSS